MGSYIWPIQFNIYLFLYSKLNSISNLRTALLLCRYLLLLRCVEICLIGEQKVIWNVEFFFIVIIINMYKFLLILRLILLPPVSTKKAQTDVVQPTSTFHVAFELGGWSELSPLDKLIFLLWSIVFCFTERSLYSLEKKKIHWVYLSTTIVGIFNKYNYVECR